jgi:small subunit ribosomal protein S3
MTHKTHPKIYRAKGIKNWDFKGYYEKDFAQKLREDFLIKKFLEEKIGSLYIEKIEIERSATKIKVVIHTPRPGMVIGRKGEDVEKLKAEIEEKILKRKGELKLEVKEVSAPWSSATLVAKWMANQIEKRVPYRRVMKSALSRIMSQKGVEGAKVQLKGRLDGIEIARTEWMKKGRLPRQTLRSDIDYGATQAYCSYGVIGIKVWIFKGQKFE